MPPSSTLPGWPEILDNPVFQPGRRMEGVLEPIVAVSPLTRSQFAVTGQSIRPSAWLREIFGEKHTRENRIFNEGSIHMLEPTRPSSLLVDSSGLHVKRLVDTGTALGELPDLLLVERTRGRDLRAFDTLVRRYNRRLYRIARSILPDPDAAEEAVRAAFARAYTNLDRYEPAGKFGAWLARLAFNEALALRRYQPSGSASSRPRGETEPAPAGHSASHFSGHSASRSAGPSATHPASPSAGAETITLDPITSVQALERAIDTLPEVFRTVLVLRVIEDLSGVEVAACLGLNETTVRTRLYRAQQRLKVDIVRRLRAEPSHVFELHAERSERIATQVQARVQALTPATESR